ncbi:unnamed protein product [Rangifer tarandus platyrhynchus]|uniref:Uncharacterized protein n=2 Tax=Rangifer tarandus platyrhynchus TaxID=3082113 RepID=A0ABN8YAH8_RANTA|nr:unnamed protein product [Rangifer tarandus platyrhynchus]CAI9698220.1 unnamed protein product [Rangifer tarandus platyrhynchus]
MVLAAESEMKGGLQSSRLGPACPPALGLRAVVVVVAAQSPAAQASKVLGSPAGPRPGPAGHGAGPARRSTEEVFAGCGCGAGRAPQAREQPRLTHLSPEKKVLRGN